MDNLKFELGQEVYVKYENTKGLIIGWNMHPHRENRYEVRIEGGPNWQSSNPWGGQAQEYLGKTVAIINVPESGLTLCEHDDHMLDALRYIAAQIEKDGDEKANGDFKMMGLNEQLTKGYVDENNDIKTAKDWMEAVISQTRDIMGRPFTLSESPVENSVCDHKWKLYDSGFSRYEFCELCDHKKFD